jgi:flagellin
MSKLFSVETSTRAIRHHGKTSNKLEANARKLSGGSRIVKASDDAAGLSIVSKSNANTRSKQMANRNTNDAISIVQVMEGRLTGMSSSLVRIRELAIAASSGTYSDTERAMHNKEAQELLKEIDRVNDSTRFNGRNLFSGKEGSLDIQVDSGSKKENRIRIDLNRMAHSTHALGVKDASFDTQHRARLSLAKIDHAIKEVSSSIAFLASVHKRFEHAVSKGGNDVINSKYAQSKVADTDYANETAKKVKNTILESAQTSVMTQANNLGSNYLKLLG